MSPLSTVPDLCLLAILDRVPVHDLYHTVPLVCKRWTTLHDTACHRRKTLILLHKPDNLCDVVDCEIRIDLWKYVLKDDGTPYRSETILANYRNSCLVFPFYYAEQSQLTRLTQLFPKVETLKIIQYNLSIYELCQMSQTLDSWSLCQRIKELQLFVCIEFAEDVEDNLDENMIIKHYISEIMKRITSSMNSTLKSLSVEFIFPREFQGNVSFDLKILSKLESFIYGLNGLDDEQYDTDEPLRALQNYNSKTLRKILITDSLKLESLVKLLPEISQKFTGIHINDKIVRENVENFKLFCTQFTSLTRLAIEIGDCERFFRQVIRSVAKLKHLIHLTAVINLNIEDEQVQDDTIEDEIPQLPLVVALSLFVKTKSHHNLGLLDLTAIMPNVQVVHLRHDSARCTDCGYGPFTLDQLKSFIEDGKQTQMSHSMIAQMQQCMKQAWGSMIAFEKLRIIYVSKMPMMFNEDEEETEYEMELTRDELIEELKMSI